MLTLESKMCLVQYVVMIFFRAECFMSSFMESWKHTTSCVVGDFSGF